LNIIDFVFAHRSAYRDLRGSLAPARSAPRAAPAAPTPPTRYCPIARAAAIAVLG